MKCSAIRVLRLSWSGGGLRASALLLPVLLSFPLIGQPLISTVAGSGRELQGIGGSATAVPLGELYSLAADSSGNLYFTDRTYDVVGRIDIAGKLWRVAGTGTFAGSADVGPANQASFRYPQGLAVGTDGSVYVGDTENSRVRRIRPDGTIETIAGCGCVNWGEGGPATQAWAGFPMSVAVNAAGEVFFADALFNVIRKIDKQGMIHTVVGFMTSPPQSDPGFGGDGGPASQARLNTPTKITFDAAGNLYIADSGNSRIRRVALDGIISTVVGGGSQLPANGLTGTTIALNLPADVSVDMSRNLVVADTWHNLVLKVFEGGIVRLVAGSLDGAGFAGDGGPANVSRLAQPNGLAFDAAGNLYIADSGNGRIRKVDTNGAITTFAGSGGTNYGGDGNAATLGRLDRPLGCAFDSQGNLFIADTGNHRIRKVDLTGTITTVAGTGAAGFSGDGGVATAAKLNSPASVAVDGTGNLFVSDSQNRRIRKIDRSGQISTFAGSASGAWYCGDDIPAMAACLGLPIGIAVDGGGSLWIADAGNARIRRVTPDGSIHTVAGNGNQGYSGDGGPALSATLWSPNVVLPDPRGGYFIADTLNHRTRYVDSTGVIRTVAGTGIGSDSIGEVATASNTEYPSGLALGRDGALYIGGGGSAILRVTPDGRIARIAGDTNPFSAMSGYSGDGGPSFGALMNLPAGMAIDTAGNLYVADKLNDRIRKIAIAESSLSIPVILSSAGLGSSFFSSELALVNRGSTDAAITYTYTAAAGGSSGTATDTLPAGRQMVIPDAISYLRGLNVPLGDSGNRYGTLRVSLSGLSYSEAAGATVRTTTTVPEGRAGLAYPGRPPGRLFSSPVFICGLRQSLSDRSNVAVSNAGTPSDGTISLRLTVFSGDPAQPGTAVLPDISLSPGEFRQVSGILSTDGLSLSNGFVKIERVTGTAPFIAYGVINDQVNSDGSFVDAVPAILSENVWAQTLPVLVETSAFSTELILTNLTASPWWLHFEYVSSALTGGRISFDLHLLPNEQQILPGFVQILRDRGFVHDPPGAAFAGALFISDPSAGGISIGARVTTPGGGGRYGLFYQAVPAGSEAKTTAWLYGLEQNSESRTNLALINVGSTDSSADVLRIDIYDGTTGQKTSSTEVTVPAQGFLQIGTVFTQLAPTVSAGYASVTRTSGNNPFVAYAVINDGGSPGQRSGDGTFVEAQVPVSP